MENNTNLDNLLSSSQSVPGFSAQKLMAGVFSWMFLALCISAVFAYIFGHYPPFQDLISNPVTGGRTLLGWIIALSPFGFILLLSAGYENFSLGLNAFIFIAFSALMGISLSSVFVFFDPNSLAMTFGITAVTFGVMAITGYTTKTDLTKFGNILIMALVGVIIASLINFFLHSSALDLIMSLAGVVIFTGLTAYDVQKIKNMSLVAEQEGMDMRKLSIMAALTLYLDFVNLFLFLLRFFGRRR